jgi:hypothetical protein
MPAGDLIRDKAEELLPVAEAAGQGIVHQLGVWLDRLNLANTETFLGQHFLSVIAVQCVIVGGFLLFFGWRHHRFILGTFGFLAGGWVGLMLKTYLVPEGMLPPLIYLGACGAIGTFAGIHLYRVMGSILGGFFAVWLGSVFLPETFSLETPQMIPILMIFFVGFGFGLTFPRFFFINVSSLIGASLATFGLSVLAGSTGFLPAELNDRIVLHLLVFLPLFGLGIVYQVLWDMANPHGVEPKKETKEIIIRTESGEAVHLS